MRLNYNNYPSIKCIEQKSLEMPVAKEDASFFIKSGKEFYDRWKDNVDHFSNIVVLTKPFRDAAIEASDKIVPFYLLKEDDVANYELSKTFIFNQFVLMCHFKADINDTNGLLYHSFFLFDKNTGVPRFFTYCNATKSGIESLIWASELYGLHNDKNSLREFETQIIGQAVAWDVFIKYARVETKHLAPGQKIKGIDCNYKNETKSPVTILDSTWFTNLVKSDAFKVRGHFRLQPKKIDGEWTKELIWISEFMKTGYTAPARKLKEEGGAL